MRKLNYRWDDNDKQCNNGRVENGANSGRILKRTTENFAWNFILRVEIKQS